MVSRKKANLQAPIRKLRPPGAVQRKPPLALDNRIKYLNYVSSSTFVQSFRQCTPLSCSKPLYKTSNVQVQCGTCFSIALKSAIHPVSTGHPIKISSIQCIQTHPAFPRHLRRNLPTPIEEIALLQLYIFLRREHFNKDVLGASRHASERSASVCGSS